MKASEPVVWASCEKCGRRFWRHASQVRHRGPARFCSRRCKDGDTSRRRSAKCRNCGERFDRAQWHMGPGRGSFCDRRCYDTWRHEHRTKLVTLTCLGCGSEFVRPAAWVKKGASKYCSRRCQGDGRYRGPKLPRRGRRWRELAESIRERDGQVCVRCGQPESSGKSLNVDHVLPARLFERDPSAGDNPLNLASLCTACHAIKTHRYEPRILKGDMLAIEEFYDADVRLRVMALLP